MIFDSHTHIDTGVGLGIGIENENPQELSDFEMLIVNKRLGVLANAASTAEYEVLSRIEGAFVSFGIHPWNVDEFCACSNHTDKEEEKKLEKYIYDKLVELKNYYKNSHAVGEIGMDSVWCDCELTLQRKVFIDQLNIAEALNKPIVLHTKGQEKEIAEILKGYTMRKLVHWYSCEQYAESYIEQDCYFTVGPNYKTSTAVKKVISLVPLDRLLVETDGISAVEWAVDRKIKAHEIPLILRETMQAIAEEKNVTVEIVEEKLEQNFYRFISMV